MPARATHHWLFSLIASCWLLSLPLVVDASPRQPSAVSEILSSTRLDRWANLLSSAAQDSESVQLERVNRFINDAIVYASDQQLWGQDDYWATPEETLKLGQGDCEDFAIAKYFGLLKLGVPVERLRLTYVKTLSRNSAHMVLAYYASPNAQPLILDNLNSQVLPAAARRDLLPVYSFNAQGIYLAKAPTQKIRQPVSMLTRWDELTARINNDSDRRPLL